MALTPGGMFDVIAALPGELLTPIQVFQVQVEDAIIGTNPMTTLGDTTHGGAAGVATRLPGNTTTTRKFYRQVGNGSISAAPAWDTIAIGDVSGLVSSQWTTTGSDIYYNTGNVGIGTATILDKLHIAGNFRLQSASPIITWHDTTAVTGVKMTQGSTAGFCGWSANRDFPTGTIFDTGKTTATYVMKVDNGESYQAWYTTPTNNTQPIERMRLDKNGNVGIGISTPRKQLDVLSTTQAQLRLSYADNSVYADFTVGSGGNLTIAPTGDLIFDPTGNDVVPAVAYDLNFGAIDKKWLTDHFAELRSETLVAAETMATFGGRGIFAPCTLLIADLAPGATTIDVKHNNLPNGERIYMETVGQVEFMAVTSGPTTITGGYRYSVTRNLDLSGANQWYAGDSIATTAMFIDVYSTRGVKSGTEVGPTIVGNVRNSAVYNDWSPRWAIGNLQGLYGYGSAAFGVAFGKYDGLSTFITVDDVNGYRTFGPGPVVVQQIDNSGNIRVGELGAGKANTFISAGSFSIRLNTTNLFNVDTSGNVTLGTVATNQGNAYWNNTTKTLQFRGGAAGTVVQSYIDTTGAVIAGAGSTILNSSGISLLSGTGYSAASSYKHVVSGTTIADFYAFQVGSPIFSNSAVMRTRAIAGYTSEMYLQAEATTGDIALVSVAASVNSVSQGYLQIWSSTPKTIIGFASSGVVASFRTAGLTLGADAAPNATLDVRGNILTTGHLVVGNATLKAWSAGYVLQGATGSFFFGNVGDTHFLSNAYNDSGGWKYHTTGPASDMYLYAGDFVIRHAASGTINTAITWTERFKVYNDGGVTVGLPTGASKGAGTINVAGDIYKNNVAYTSPDYILEHWATGKIEKYASKAGAQGYAGLTPLPELKTFIKENFHLPGFGQKAGHGLFSGGDGLLASLEEAYLYIFELEERLSKLERVNN